ncbi:MAG: CARDB domain-containing protein [Candidatus Thermoplasmatota archaeon]
MSKIPIILILLLMPMFQAGDKPDLTLSQADIKFSNDNPNIGEKITITATIHNIGSADAFAVTVNFNGTYMQIGTKVIDSIPKKENRTVSIDWTPYMPGRQTIKVYADPQNSIQEENENNNEATRDIIVGTTPSVITVDAKLEPEKCIPKENFWVNGSATLVGEPVKNATVRIKILETKIEAITTTDSYGIFSKNLTAPEKFGTYNVSIEVEAYVKGTTKKQLGVFGPDIIVDSIEFSNSAPRTDELVKINAVLKSGGIIGVDNFTLTFYIDDKLIEKKNISMGKEVSTIFFEWLAKEGKHKIRIVADEENSIAEMNETNNEKTRVLIVKKKYEITTTEWVIIGIIVALAFCAIVLKNWYKLRKLKK